MTTINTSSWEAHARKFVAEYEQLTAYPTRYVTCDEVNKFIDKWGLYISIKFNLTLEHALDEPTSYRRHVIGVLAVIEQAYDDTKLLLSSLK